MATTRVDPTIYLTCGPSLGMDDALFRNLNERIMTAAASATEISIVSGYYDVETIRRICVQVPKGRRAACTIGIVLGVDLFALMPNTIADLRALRKWLRECGFRDKSITVNAGPKVHHLGGVKVHH